MKRAYLFLKLMLLAGIAYGTPNPTSYVGSVTNGQQGTLLGTGFGSKAQGGGKYWAVFTFEDGTYNSSTSLGWGSISLGRQNQDIVNEARGFTSTRMSKSPSTNWADFTNGGITAVDILMPSVGRGGKVYKGLWRKSSRSAYTHVSGGTKYENWKFDRFWVNTNGSGYPNAYTAQNADSPTSCTGGGSRPSPTVEPGAGSAYVKTSSAYRLPGSTWMLEERLLKFASANATGNGIYRIRQDGALNINRTDFMHDPSPSFPASDLRRWYTQDDPSNLTQCGGSTVSHDVWYDKVVIDYGPDAWARVLVSTSPTFAGSVKFELQYPQAWSSVAVTFVVDTGDLPLGVNYYGYVCDSNDDCNANGQLLGASGNPAPVVNVVVPNTGAVAGGNTVVVNGANFLAGAQVVIGTSAATGENVLTSTAIACVVPARSSTGTVNVSVTNVDTQSGTGLNLYSYTPSSPTVSAVTPSTCTTVGGCVVTLTGTSLLEIQGVTFGGTSATNETSISETQMNCTVPAHAVGAVDVTVTTNAGSGTLTSGFTYEEPPVLPTEKICPCIGQ